VIWPSPPYSEAQGKTTFFIGKGRVACSGRGGGGSAENYVMKIEKKNSLLPFKEGWFVKSPKAENT